MLHRSPKAYQNKRNTPRTTFETETKTSTQHGIHFLLDVPAEILAAISANLDPQSLQHLSETHEHFARHVDQDITWRGAFETHYISNEQSLLLLRRTQPTSWRKEFTERFNLLQRFLYSRQSTVAHAPLPSLAISRIHLLSPGDPGFGLLSISLFHGSIARSVPSTGKILPGFIDASGSTTGSGSRTSEFTANVSACAITSTGGTVRILRGYATGHVAFMVTNRTIDNPRRPAAEFRICQFEEMHAGCVTDAVWMTEASDTSYGGEAIAVTGGLDGHVKIWNFSDASTPDILWTSPHKPTDPRDPCIKVACNRALGMVVGVKKSGAVDIWTGFTPNGAEQLDLRRIAVESWRTGEARPSAKVLALHIDPYTRAVLVGFHGDLCFYRIDITQEGEESYGITAFGAPEGGGILSCLQPCFTSRDKEGAKSFILAGDKLGYVNVYPWDNVTSSTTGGSLQTMVRPTRSFQATSQQSGLPSQNQAPSKHRHSPAAAFNFKANSQQQQQQAAITAITWTPTILATGTSAGHVVVWDSITFERVKEVVSAAKLRRVRRRGGGGHHHHHNLQNAQAQQQAQGQQGQQGQAAPGGIGAAQGFEVEDNSVPDDSVKQIIMSEKGDTLIVNVGGEVVMWKAGEVSVDESAHNNKGKMRGGKSRSGKSTASAGANSGRALIGGASGRWSEQLEMKQAISESHALYLTDWDAHIDTENPARKARRDNERAHRRELEKMGMSEEEMLEYVMMLSREQQQQQGGDEGGSGSSGSGNSGRAETSASASGAKGNQDALTDEQVQAAIEGGVFTMDSGPSAIPTASPSPAPIDREGSSLNSETHFPSISPPISRSSSGSPSGMEGSAGAQQVHPASLRNRRLSVTSNCTSVSSSSSSSSSGSWKSAVSRASAWNVPLAVASSPTPATANATAAGTSNAATPSSGGRARGAWDGMDEELRFALELSLAEARSRGEDV